MEIKKAVIPVAGLGTRFLPLSKIIPKELWPLADKPVLQYIVEEAFNSNIKEIIFIISPEKQIISDYFNNDTKKDSKLINVLKARKKYQLLKELENLKKIAKKISFSYVVQKKPLGDGNALLCAKELVKNNAFAVLFGDDVVEAKEPCLAQLKKIFKKNKKPVLSLCKVDKERISSYGVVKVKKINSRIYSVKDIIEKPLPEKAPSNLAIVGKFILTPDIFEYFSTNNNDISKEFILVDALKNMLQDKKIVLGYEFKGKWLECGNKLAYLKSNFYFSLKHSEFGKKLKEVKSA